MIEVECKHVFSNDLKGRAIYKPYIEVICDIPILYIRKDGKLFLQIFHKQKGKNNEPATYSSALTKRIYASGVSEVTVRLGRYRTPMIHGVLNGVTNTGILLNKNWQIERT